MESVIAARRAVGWVAPVRDLRLVDGAHSGRGTAEEIQPLQRGGNRLARVEIIEETGWLESTLPSIASREIGCG